MSKCAVTLGAPASTLPATGGTGSIALKTERECQWTAASEAAWLTLSGGASGQGEGTIQYRVGANADPVQRTGAIVANGQRTEVAQAPGECRFDLASASASFPNAGGSGTVQVRASSPLCAWTASSDADWISIRSGADGKGTAVVTYDVAPTGGPPRTGAMRIAGQRYTVTQSEGCAFSIAPTAYAADASGGSGGITVTTAAGCPWTAASNVEWVTVNPTTALTGSGTVRFAVAPSAGPPRTGTLNVAGEMFTVTQAAGCTYQVSPATHSVDAAGGSRSVTVNAQGGCGWEVASNASWITVTAGHTGAGTGTVTFDVAATNGPSRSGTLTVAGRTVTVTQGQGCTYSIVPDNHSVPAGGGSGTVSVTAGAGCSWTASSNVSWASITSGGSGSGAGSVAYSVAGTTGPSRSGTLTIAGRTFTINQGQGCTFALSSSAANVPVAGGTGSFNVTTSDGCGWSAASNASWITITSGAGGSGDGTVSYSVEANSGPSRQGTITAGGQTFTVDQAGGCAFTLSSAAASSPAEGGSGSFNVATSDGCGWSASSNAGWITITSGASGSGPGTVAYTVAANSGAPRQGTITAAERTFTIDQAGGCSATLAPADQTVPAAGGGGSFAVNTADGCQWTATAGAAWISIAAGGSGTGGGTVQFTAEPNSGPARAGTISVLGQTFTVRQDGGCSYDVTPNPGTAPAAGGTVSVNVGTAAECTWNASSNTDWITVVSGAAGAGNGTVQLGVQANTGTARSGTAIIAGRTVTIDQASGCTFTIAPESADFKKEGGTGSVTVAASDGCAWTAVSNVPWSTVTAGSAGAGGGTVQYTVAPNPDPATRNGTLTIAGRPFSVKQDGSQ